MRAFLYTSTGGMLNLGTLLAMTDSRAYDINNGGVVVGDCYNATDVRPFVWTASSGMQDLNAVLPANSGWTLTSARNINNQGQVVGNGIHNGQVRAFVLTLVPGPIPLFRADNGGYSFITPSGGEFNNLVSNGWFDVGPIGNLYAGATDQPGLTALYRLYSPGSGNHFYTTSLAERNTIVGNASYVDEGISGYVFPGTAAGRKPLYRAYNPQTGQHRFIGNPDEYNTLPAPWQKEGTAAYVLPGDPVLLYRGDYRGTLFYLTTSRAESMGAERYGYITRGAVGRVFTSSNDAPGLTALYRLGSPFTGDHFYTTNAAEKNAIQPFYTYEGIQGYVFTGPGDNRKPLYRAYNPQTGQHLFSGELSEYNNLPAPWQKEGVAAYILN